MYQRVDAARGLMARDPEESARMLDEVGGQVKATIGDLRRLVYQLRPPMLAELGLVGAIEEACQGLAPMPAQLRVDVVVPSPMPALPAGVEVAAYRIAVEAVTNVVKHAHATSCTVRLTVDDAVRVEVVDDGVGLAPGFRPSVGLRSMRERAEELVGTFSIVSNVPHGTIVSAELPLTDDMGEQST